jgi:protein TonB
LAAIIVGFIAVPQPEVRPYQLRTPVDQLVSIDPLPFVLPEVDRVPPRHSAVPIPSADGPATDPSVGVHTFSDIHQTVTEPAVEPLPYWKVERKPVLVQQVVPEYPELARSAGIEGSVVVSAVVDTAGLVARAAVLSSSGSSLLDAAAVAACRGFRFTPAYQQDRPVPVQVSIPFSFRLQ